MYLLRLRMTGEVGEDVPCYFGFYIFWPKGVDSAPLLVETLKYDSNRTHN